jgi:hypothetical protein
VLYPLDDPAPDETVQRDVIDTRIGRLGACDVAVLPFGEEGQGFERVLTSGQL